jgi:hypothetical protein
MNDDETTTPGAKRNPYRNTIGSIVSWAIFRTALVMFIAMFVYEYVHRIDYVVWWSITLISLYAFVVHPIQIQYELYKKETKTVVTGTLCASCRHFEPTGVLCSILDEHVTENYVPCEGLSWEPKPVDENRKDVPDEL